MLAGLPNPPTPPPNPLPPPELTALATLGRLVRLRMSVKGGKAFRLRSRNDWLGGGGGQVNSTKWGSQAAHALAVGSRHGPLGPPLASDGFARANDLFISTSKQLNNTKHVQKLQHG